jgi:hypothetical protein
MALLRPFIWRGGSSPIEAYRHGSPCKQAATSAAIIAVAVARAAAAAAPAARAAARAYRIVPVYSIVDAPRSTGSSIIGESLQYSTGPCIYTVVVP